MLECLMDVVECEVGLPADYGSSVPDELPQDRNYMAHQVVSEEVPQQGQRSHNHEGILILEVLNYCVVHKQAKLVSRLNQECCEEICHFLKVEVWRLAEVNREYMGEGGVIS